MNREIAINIADCLRRKKTVFTPNGGSKDYESISLAKKATRGFKCIELQPGEVLPARFHKQEVVVTETSNG